MNPYVILVNNGSSSQQPFWIVQKPAECSVSTARVVSCSLGTNLLSPGAHWRCVIDGTVYAGAEGPATTSVSLTVVNRTFVCRPVLSGQPVANATILSFDPLALSTPANKPEVPDGSFCIAVPSFTPSSRVDYRIGGAQTDESGMDFLSYFTAPPPRQNVSFTPAPVFYVSVGSFRQGEPVALPPGPSYATCDFRSDLGPIVTTYNSDGSWTVR